MISNLYLSAAALLCLGHTWVQTPVGSTSPPSTKEQNAPPAQGERNKVQLLAGQQAPDFVLPLASGQHDVKLSSFRGKKPVVLIFGSYT